MALTEDTKAYLRGNFSKQFVFNASLIALRSGCKDFSHEQIDKIKEDLLTVWRESTLNRFLNDLPRIRKIRKENPKHNIIYFSDGAALKVDDINVFENDLVDFINELEKEYSDLLNKWLQYSFE